MEERKVKIFYRFQWDLNEKRKKMHSENPGRYVYQVKSGVRKRVKYNTYILRDETKKKSTDELIKDLQSIHKKV